MVSAHVGHGGGGSDGGGGGGGGGGKLGEGGLRLTSKRLGICASTRHDARYPAAPVQSRVESDVTATTTSSVG